MRQAWIQLFSFLLRANPKNRYYVNTPRLILKRYRIVNNYRYQ